LTRQVMFIEDQLGATRVGRREDDGFVLSRKDTPAYLRVEERFDKGELVDKSHALSLTVGINTQFTKVLFTKESPTWNHNTSQFLLELLQDISTDPEMKTQGHHLTELLEFNIPIANQLNVM